MIFHEKRRIKDNLILIMHQVEKRVPWFVWLKIDTRNGTKVGRRCGSTLIDPNHVISAAHCFCIKVFFATSQPIQT